MAGGTLYQFSNVTNSAVRKITSGGAAYTLTLPFQADYVEWFNYTKFATDTAVNHGTWFRGFPAGDSLNHVVATTTLSPSLETTNGFTVANTGPGFTNQHVSISAITPATPGVVTTATAHGLTTNDRVIITNVQGTMAPSVNNIEFVVVVVDTTHFSLYDIYGNPYTTTGAATASTGTVNKEGPRLGVVNSPVIYKLTLGTSIMGAASDVIYVYAAQVNDYLDLGQV